MVQQHVSGVPIHFRTYLVSAPTQRREALHVVAVLYLISISSSLILSQLLQFIN